MSDYLTLIFRKPVSNLVQEVFSKQEWVAASHSHVMRDRDNYEREVVRLKEENARLQAEVDALREVLSRILENEASDWKAAEEFGGYVLDDELREEARAALAKDRAEVES